VTHMLFWSAMLDYNVASVIVNVFSVRFLSVEGTSKRYKVVV